MLHGHNVLFYCINMFFILPFPVVCCNCLYKTYISTCWELKVHHTISDAAPPMIVILNCVASHMVSYQTTYVWQLRFGLDLGFGFTLSTYILKVMIHLLVFYRIRVRANFLSIKKPSFKSVDKRATLSNQQTHDSQTGCFPDKHNVDQFWPWQLRCKQLLRYTSEQGDSSWC